MIEKNGLEGLTELEAAIVFVDVVESVRLLQQSEKDTVETLRRLFSTLIDEAVLPASGQVVERQGDGLLLQFAQSPDAVRCALDMHACARRESSGRTGGSAIQLRIGIHSDRLLSDARLLYGSAVSLAARVLQVAGPGETIVTNAVRDVLTDDIDVDIEDMGLCFLKHWEGAIRLWRVKPVTPLLETVTQPAVQATAAPDGRLPVAVLNFECPVSLTPGIADFLNGALVAGLTRQPTLKVTSPLSAKRLKAGVHLAHENASHLGVHFVLAGSMQQLGGRLIVNPQLIDARNDEVVWADQVMDTLDAWIQPQSQAVQRVLDACVVALTEAQARAAHHTPLPQLDSHALMAGAINLMHRASGGELQRSENMLHAVIERHRRVASPRAWMAKWHVLAAVQGWSPDASLSHMKAIESANRALDIEPDSALALAVKGHALCHQGQSIGEALELLNAAIATNPSEASAWLYRSIWHHMWGGAADALCDARIAIELSPLDPQRAHFDLVLGVAHLAANELPQAMEAFGQSVRRNQCHLPALRALLTAQHELGLAQEARQTLARVLALAPHFTVSSFLSTGTSSPIRQRVARALSDLGLPIH